jgi:hypothetical protein
VDIHVSISASKSVAITGSTITTFGALPVSAAAVSGSSITVTNDSGAYIESYALQGANATSDTNGTPWTLSLTTGTNQYALGAMFGDGSTAPANTTAVWGYNNAALYLTSGVQNCSATQFGNNVAGQTGVSVDPDPASTYTNNRALWFRMITPSVTSGTEGRTAKVYISVQ